MTKIAKFFDRIPVGIIFVTSILVALFSIGPLLWAFSAWHCYWLPAAGVCQ